MDTWNKLIMQVENKDVEINKATTNECIIVAAWNAALS